MATVAGAELCQIQEPGFSIWVSHMRGWVLIALAIFRCFPRLLASSWRGGGAASAPADMCMGCLYGREQLKHWATMLAPVLYFMLSIACFRPESVFCCFTWYMQASSSSSNTLSGSYIKMAIHTPQRTWSSWLLYSRPSRILVPILSLAYSPPPKLFLPLNKKWCPTIHRTTCTYLLIQIVSFLFFPVLIYLNTPFPVSK